MLPNSRYTFEICVDTPAAVNAASLIADRIELCGGLDIGGLTPDFGMMEYACAAGVETHVLIRTRSGDFTMSSDDLSVAVSSIRTARQMGLKGVVIGAERGSELDRSALETMVVAADGMDVTLHRVIDILDDPVPALEVAVELGAVRILTSGGAPNAVDGREGLKTLLAAAAGRIEIMAGGGINSSNIASLIDSTDITSFHSSCSTTRPLDQRYPAFGFGAVTRSFDAPEALRLANHLQRQHNR